MRRSRGSPNSNSNKEKITQRAVSAEIHRATKGFSFRPPLTPPQFSFQQFNNATIRMKKSGSANYWITSVDIHEAICNQLGLYIGIPAGTGTTYYYLGIEYQILKIMAWNLDPGVAVIKMSPIDFVDNDGSAAELANCGSTSQKNQYACVGFTFPASHQNKVWQFDQGKKSKKIGGDKFNVAYFDCEEGAVLEIHFSIKWRTRYTADLTQEFVYKKTYDPTCPTSHNDETTEGPGNSPFEEVEPLSPLELNAIRKQLSSAASATSEED